jgi:uncharacterized protein YhjY with autotransporter beta-barrel domain
MAMDGGKNSDKSVFAKSDLGAVSETRVVGAKKPRKKTRFGKRDILLAIPALFLMIGAAIAHTVSVGYESLGGGSFNFWFGSYHSGVNYTEGSLQLTGPGGFSATVPFNLLVSIKPAGLVDGTTNFYSNGTSLGTVNIYPGPVIVWQGAKISGLTTPGAYTFTYIPIASPTSVWQPEDAVILSSTFTITASQLMSLMPTLGPTPGPTAPQTVGIIAMNSFLSQMLPNPLGGGSGCGFGQGNNSADPHCFQDETTTGSNSFAPDRPDPPEGVSAYAAINKAARLGAPPEQRHWSIWASGYGAYNKTTSTDAAATAQVAGVASGLEYRVSRDTLLGVALGGASSSFGLSGNLGGGSSDIFQAGTYAFHRMGPAYLSAALAYAGHNMSTNRNDLTGDNFTASFFGNSFGGRIESGYRFMAKAVGITPYGAFQAQTFLTPSYSESSATAPAFALTSNSATTNATRVELGAWFDQTFLLANATPLTLRARAAWAHDHTSDATVTAAFLGTPTTTFIVNGVAPVPNVALMSASAELKLAKSWSVLAKFDGEFANRSQTYAGTGTLRYTW